MANTLYDSARKAWAQGNIAWGGDLNFLCLLVNARYTFSTGHVMVSSVPPEDNGPRDYGLSGVTGIVMENLGVADNGAIYADPVRFQTVEANLDPVTAIIIYRDGGGDENEANLIYYANVATGLPITPNGGDIIVTWSTGTNRILRL